MLRGNFTMAINPIVYTDNIVRSSSSTNMYPKLQKLAYV